MLHYTVHFFFLWRSTPHSFRLFSVWWWATDLILFYLTESHNWVVRISALYLVVPSSNIDPEPGYRKIISWSPLRHFWYLTLNISRPLPYTSFTIYYRKPRYSCQHSCFVFWRSRVHILSEDYCEGLGCFTESFLANFRIVPQILLTSPLLISFLIDYPLNNAIQMEEMTVSLKKLLIN